MTYEKIFSALADPTRRHVFESLRTQARSVADIASTQPVSRPAVSQHLKVLQDAGLVNVQPNGTRRMYSVNRAGLEALRTYLDSFWTDALSAYAEQIQKQLQTN